MITLAILQGVSGFLVVIFALFPSLPNLPESITNGLNSFLDLIFDNVGVLGVFVPISTIKVVVPLILVIVNFDKIYKLVTWVLKKIPFIGFKD